MASTAPTDRDTVLITGCNPGGIGNSLARAFHAAGLHVIATARQISSIADLHDIGCTTLALELTSDTSIASAASRVSSLTHGKLSYLVNCAGRNYTVPAVELDMDEVATTFDVNVFVVMKMCAAFAPLVIAARGTIVQIGSLAAIMPYVFGSAYNASKAALHAYSDTLRVELAPFGVRVVNVVTGGVKSRIARTVRELKGESIYLPLEAEYLRRQTHSQEVGVDNTEYAEYVVRKLLGGWNTREIWYGGGSTLVWFVHMFLPRRVMVRITRLICLWQHTDKFQDLAFAKMFNLWKLNDTYIKKLA